MAFGVIYNYIVARTKRIDQAENALVAEIEQNGIFLHFKSSQLPFKFFMMIGVAAHHPGSHGTCQSILGSRIGICLPDDGVVGKSKVVVQAPDNFFF